MQQGPGTGGCHRNDTWRCVLRPMLSPALYASQHPHLRPAQLRIDGLVAPDQGDAQLCGHAAPPRLDGHVVAHACKESSQKVVLGCVTYLASSMPARNHPRE